MLTYSIDRMALRARAAVTVLALPAKDFSLVDEWQHCTAFINATYAGCSGRAFLASASFTDQRAFERDPVYPAMLEAAYLDLEAQIERSLRLFSEVLS